MNRQERLSIISKCKPQTWHTYCLLEARYGGKVKTTKAKLAAEFEMTVSTLNRYLTAWESLGLIKKEPGGFVITELDGQPSGITGEVKIRKFKKAQDVLDLWCKLYQEKYDQEYRVSNFGMTLKHLKGLMRYKDEEIEGGITAAITFYDSKWKSPQFPRPTVGQLVSWLFQQALPYAEIRPNNNTEVTEFDMDAISSDMGSVETERSEDVLNNLLDKGWL